MFQIGTKTSSQSVRLAYNFSFGLFTSFSSALPHSTQQSIVLRWSKRLILKEPDPKVDYGSMPRFPFVTVVTAVLPVPVTTVLPAYNGAAVGDPSPSSSVTDWSAFPAHTFPEGSTPITEHPVAPGASVLNPLVAKGFPAMVLGVV